MSVDLARVAGQCLFPSCILTFSTVQSYARNIFLNFLFKMSRELCACFVDDDCVLLYIKQARVVDSMLYKDKTEHSLINRGAHLSLNIL